MSDTHLHTQLKAILPTISVLMPVYNAERYVAEAVESILAQTYRDFEFLIVDDGSTDGSLAILQRYAARDQRIRIISRHNTGLVQALNEGLTLARGKYIARMDSDDISITERFASQVDFLDSHLDVVTIGSRIMVVDPTGSELSEMLYLQSHELIDREHLLGNCSISHPAAMIRSDILRDLGGYRDSAWPAEDLDLWLRLAEVGRLANLPQVLLKYRQHLQSIGHSRWSLQRDRARAVVLEAHERRGLSTPEKHDYSSRNEFEEVELYQKWAWWALTSGHIATARKHAFAALRRRPLAPSSWRLAYCVIRGF